MRIRERDPLYIASKGVLEQLVDATGHSALLCMLFSNSVLCIREHLTPYSPENMFSRGQLRPLFKGAMSNVILSNLPPHRLRSIYAKDGYVMTLGEFNPNVYGVGAPVFNVEKLIIGSIGVAWQKEELPEVDVAKTILAVKRGAEPGAWRSLRARSDEVV
ncbi:hypothetical protein [Sinorhizobium meliloti]|uniref:IclR family transcriptional regulator domain-containing protein n=1 Tax=Rhizobium meliloti TaxID=382 RepID=UPI000FD40205|nr:hypothetical protein [Sinorhizobium meliloti]RVR13180.1 hypothetical protein CN243_00955 [Sinorhizobium meliloti]